GEQLAPFKIPRRIVVVEQLPKGKTGKVQRKRLSETLQSEPERSAASDENWHAQLLQLWKKFLKTEDVSIDDDFFEKGGDSLLALELQHVLQRLTGRELPEWILLEASTIRALAKKLSGLAGARQTPAARAGNLPSPLIFFHGEQAEEHSFVEILARS